MTVCVSAILNLRRKSFKKRVQTTSGNVPEERQPDKRSQRKYFDEKKRYIIGGSIYNICNVIPATGIAFASQKLVPATSNIVCAKKPLNTNAIKQKTDNEKTLRSQRVHREVFNRARISASSRCSQHFTSIPTVLVDN